MKILTDSEFDAIKFKNNMFDKNAAYDGKLFETYGREFEFVVEHNKNRIWTVLEAGEKVIITSGYHRVNRIGYLLSVDPTLEEMEYHDNQ